MNQQNTIRTERRFEITSFALHIIAMACMLCDHLWGTFLIQYEWLSYIGRLAFPIFAFLLVDGFHYTGSRRKYAIRMLGFALLTEIPFNLMTVRRVFNPIHQNVLWSYLLSILLMCIYEKISQRKHLAARILLYIIVTAGFYVLGFITFVDYYGYGILMSALFYFTRRKETDTPAVSIFKALIQFAAMYYINDEMIKGLVISFDLFGLEIEMHKQTLALLALPLLWLYRGKQGPYNTAIRYTYYLFYPVHMLVLGLLITLL